ncbi:hypothetical protein BD289DRAFT_427190 [Coniella lustricola]|uniref:Uncharacterized protein n=1 Tax=Coniella lustricola TaxID=2025994 RepID=A0A2T3AFX1_9PEZI|nr:hypothetical protein BD289DRAFT_427190 [Coniella lustricola]
MRNFLEDTHHACLADFLRLLIICHRNIVALCVLAHPIRPDSYMLTTPDSISPSRAPLFLVSMACCGAACTTVVTQLPRKVGSTQQWFTVYTL